MIFVVIILNLIITLFNLYLVVKLWQLRKLLALITSALSNSEHYLSFVLLVTPQMLHKKQLNIYHFRHNYQLWQLQLQKIRQIILLLSWLYRTWRRYIVVVWISSTIEYLLLNLLKQKNVIKLWHFWCKNGRKVIHNTERNAFYRSVFCAYLQ